jgi:hypothetical protein
MGATLFPPKSPPDLLPLEKVPKVMNFFIMVRVMWTGRFKKFLEVIYGFLTAVAITGHYGNVTGSVLLSRLATLSAFPSTFDSSLGGCSPANVGNRSRVTWDEGGPNCLFARSISSNSMVVFGCSWQSS